MLTGHDKNDVGNDHASDTGDDDDQNLDPRWQLPDDEKFNDEAVLFEHEFDNLKLPTV